MDGPGFTFVGVGNLGNVAAPGIVGALTGLEMPTEPRDGCAKPSLRKAATCPFPYAVSSALTGLAELLLQEVDRVIGGGLFGNFE